MSKPTGSDSKKKPVGSDQKKKPEESDSKKKPEGPGPSKPIGPGPGEYMLPPTIGFNKHDVRKQRMPMYSLKERFTVVYKPMGKEKGYNLENLTRYGVSRGKQFVIGDRTFMKALSDGPGPAPKRVNEKLYLKGTTAPAYTIRERHLIQHIDEGPGPAPKGADVNVAPIKPRAPAYHCGERIVIPKKPQKPTPGPADFVPRRPGITLPKSPQFIMTSREPRKPKVYNPKKDGEYRMYDLMYYRPGKKAPAFFMGDLHSRFKLPTTVKCDNI